MKRSQESNALMSNSKVYIGTSGYHYDDWKSVFYPDGIQAGQYLYHYSRFFNALELNGSFYKLPDPEHLLKYNDTRLQPFHLSMKAYREITHGDGGRALIRQMLGAIEPVVKSGVLKTLLFQFPFSFKYSDAHMNKVEMISAEIHGVLPVMEFRHRSWFSDSAMAKLTELGIVVSGTDMPTMGKLPGCRLPETGDLGYVRFHGRNNAKWWDHEHAWERYDYLCSDDTIKGLLPALKQWINKRKTTYIFFNNHYRGQAVQNAQLLMAFLTD